MWKISSTKKYFLVFVNIQDNFTFSVLDFVKQFNLKYYMLKVLGFYRSNLESVDLQPSHENFVEIGWILFLRLLLFGNAIYQGFFLSIIGLFIILD